MTSCEFLRGIICLKLYQCTYRRKREEGKSWPCLRTSLIISTQSNQPFSNFHAAKFAAIRHAILRFHSRPPMLSITAASVRPPPSGERSQFAERGSLLTAFAAVGGTACNWARYFIPLGGRGWKSCHQCQRGGTSLLRNACLIQIQKSSLPVTIGSCFHD